MKDRCFLGTKSLLYSPDGVHWDIRVDVAGDLAGVHVGDVLEVAGQAVVLHDEGVEDIGEVDVAVLIAGVDTAVLLSAGMAFNSLHEPLRVVQGRATGLDAGEREIFPRLCENISISGVKSCRPL